MRALTGINFYSSFDALTGPQKAAVFLMACDEQTSADILERMDDDEISAVSREMSRLGMVPAELVERTIREFAGEVATPGALRGSYEATQRLLEKTLPPERVADIMREIRGPAGRTIWQKLSNTPADMLAAYLRMESPQTTAVVLMKLDRAQAARVLSLLPPPLADEIVDRSLRLENVSEEILRTISETLRQEFLTTLSARNMRDQHVQMAEVLNAMEPTAADRFLVRIAAKNGRDAAKVEANMFTFRDLGKLGDGDLRELLMRGDRSRLATALRGAPPELIQRFQANLSRRAARMLGEDIAAGGPTRLRDVEAARQEFVTLAKELDKSGVIDISAAGQQDGVLVY
jgi:flagellar motor switch protein FliG